MTTGQTAGEIDDEAALWATRMDGRDLDLDPDADLTQWLEGDSRRPGAFLRAQAALSFLDRATPDRSTK
jgi:transmembrane sensor